MRKFAVLMLMATLISASATAKTRKVTLRIVETTDVHGSFFPYDYINQRPKRGSMARISTYVNRLRNTFGNNLLLLENGDLLQGQPTCYYYNYVATDEKNIGAQVTNYLCYDVQNFGNHDVECGHAVYDKWVDETNAVTLGANIIDTKSGMPYVKPYQIFVRDGVKVAVLGMLTPAIPSWLGENLWSGLRFEEMVSSSRRWIKHLKETEKPDIIVGLFHAGRDGGIITDDYEENPSERIAREVPGFDIIFYGHDHIKFGGQIESADGSKVWILDPSNNALNVADAEITFTIKDKGKKGIEVLDKKIEGRIVSIEDEELDQAFISHFKNQHEAVSQYVNRPIATFTESIYTRDSFFGSSAFTDLIQNLQLSLTGADISFNAPLAFNAKISEGVLHVSDMFNLYKFENLLCTVRMTGEEIRRHLEMSYDLWVNTMTSPDDHIMLLYSNALEDQQRLGFKNLTFNFDSAAGIIYEVDVTRPDGEKVRIISMADGTPFDLNREYKVAMNSYRANGGGELLTRGAGIKKEDINSRIIWQSEKDLRFYLMQEIERLGTVTPKANDNWRFVPEELAKPAIERDRKLLFGN